jgi:hypothetical protein
MSWHLHRNFVANSWQTNLKLKFPGNQEISWHVEGLAEGEGDALRPPWSRHYPVSMFSNQGRNQDFQVGETRRGLSGTIT